MAVLSIDLRSRVITAFEQTGNKSQVCRTFNIARTTLDDWIKLKEQTGCLEQAPWQRGTKPLIKDWDAFKAFVEQSSFDTIKQLVPLYEQYFNEPIEYERLRRAMHTIGWSRKKRASPTEKPIISTSVFLDG
jgi:transposase